MRVRELIDELGKIVVDAELDLDADVHLIDRQAEIGLCIIAGTVVITAIGTDFSEFEDQWR